MGKSNLEILIEKEQKTLNNLEAKREEIDEKIRKSRAKLQELQMMDDSEKFNALSNVVEMNGLSMENIFAALQSGDFLALQEKMEAAKNKQPENNTDDVVTD